MSETVDMTTSIITEMGSSSTPRSMCSVSLMGSQTLFHAMRVG